MAVPTDQQQQQQQLTSAQGSAAPEVAHTDSPTINVTNEEGHHAAAPEVAEESPSSGPQTSHNNRVQWSQELPTPAQNQSDSNLDPETLAKLKECVLYSHTHTYISLRLHGLLMSLLPTDRPKASLKRRAPSPWPTTNLRPTLSASAKKALTTSTLKAWILKWSSHQVSH